jgi:DNA-binding transcriptional regulator GbsR (MarR family)
MKMKDRILIEKNFLQHQTESEFNVQEQLKTPVVKKLYSYVLKLQKKYPNDDEFKVLQKEFRQLVNSIEVLERTIHQIYQLALHGALPENILIYFIELFRHWTGEHIDYRQFKEAIKGKVLSIRTLQNL